ncbi:hypothetical protein BU038_11515, partial [Staphylococcus simulans]
YNIRKKANIMKNIKFYFKGSPSEIRYLEKQQKEGYVLKDIQNNIYTFEKDPEVQNTTLQVTFARTKDLEESSQNKSKAPFLSVFAKNSFTQSILCFIVILKIMTTLYTVLLAIPKTSNTNILVSLSV